MSTLTKEWLQQTIAELEEERDAVTGVVNEDAAMALAAMKLALASLEAEPVAWLLSGGGAKNNVSFDSGNAYADPLREVTPLYTATPAPVSVPDDVLKGLLPDAEKAEFWFEHNGKILFEGVKFNNAVFDACRAAMLQGADGKPELTVWYGAMPETNGKTNWTAMLHRKGHHPWEGITIDRSEYPGRVRYEADRMRHLIGELADEPDILAYDSDAHSGYVEPVTTAYKLPEETTLSLQLRNLIRQRHAEWSQATFGDVGPVGPLKHLSKEALEAAEQPDDLSEWADMQFLLWDAQRRAGISDGEITAAMEEKLKVNMARQWPETKDGEPRLHIKAAPQQEVK